MRQEIKYRENVRMENEKENAFVKTEYCFKDNTFENNLDCKGKSSYYPDYVVQESASMKKRRKKKRVCSEAMQSILYSAVIIGVLGVIIFTLTFLALKEAILIN
jgi:hypothetical protein